jgi:hypothetical protein
MRAALGQVLYFVLSLGASQHEPSDNVLARWSDRFGKLCRRAAARKAGSVRAVKGQEGDALERRNWVCGRSLVAVSYGVQCVSLLLPGAETTQVGDIGLAQF